MNSRKTPELLVPASCLEVLKIAVLYGADAVYICLLYTSDAADD